jgi:uncharacterized membrane protein
MTKKYYFFVFVSLFFAVSCQNNPSAATVDTSVSAVAKSAAKATVNWHCAGTEPFWSVEISATDNTATIQTPEKTEAPISLVAISETADSATYTGKNLKISIKKGKCSDGMSEKDYEYSAAVDFDIYKFQGCADKTH